MGRIEGDFGKGEADGTVDALAVIVAAARRYVDRVITLSDENRWWIEGSARKPVWAASAF
jgi:hypothetical protein